jgi:hypothetical protein
VKSEIAELYELLDSNNGSQFRSLEVLPDALVEFAAGVIDKNRLGKVADIENEVPNPPAQSHVLTIDNFGNVKVFLTDADKGTLREHFARHANGEKGREATPVSFSFGRQSVEFGAGTNSTILPKVLANAFTRLAGHGYKPASLVKKLFCKAIGSNVLTLTSSSKRWNAKGEIVDVEQIATLRAQTGTRLGFRKPKIGAPLHLRLNAA